MDRVSPCDNLLRGYKSDRQQDKECSGWPAEGLRKTCLTWKPLTKENALLTGPAFKTENKCSAWVPIRIEDRRVVRPYRDRPFPIVAGSGRIWGATIASMASCQVRSDISDSLAARYVRGRSIER